MASQRNNVPAAKTKVRNASGGNGFRGPIDGTSPRDDLFDRRHPFPRFPDEILNPPDDDVFRDQQK